MIRNIIIGSGSSGAAVARIPADQFGECSLLVDVRPHAGGNCFYERNHNCIRHESRAGAGL